MAEARVLTNAILKGIMPDALVLRPQGEQDFDTFMTSGYVGVGVSGLWKNYPEGAYRYGLLLVFGVSTFTAQVYLPHERSEGKAHLYWRVHYTTSSGTGSWAKWRRIESELIV